MKISWQAPEYVYYEKNKSWYFKAIILVLILAGFFVYLDNYAGTAVILAAGLVYLTHGNKKPRLLNYSLSENGLLMGDKNLPLDKLKSFCISHDDAYPKLYLQKIGKFSTPVSVFLQNINPDIISNFLKQYLSEETSKFSDIQDNINKLLRF